MTLGVATVLFVLAAGTPAAPDNVARVQFRGNRKVEDDALRVNLRTAPGAVLTQDLLRDDVRALWRTGFFEDVSAETSPARDGLVVTYVVREKPSLHKIFVAGFDEVGLSKINEVLDLKREQILDASRVKKNAEKIRELYLQRGFYLAEVAHRLDRVDENQVDVTFQIHENARVAVRRVHFVGNHSLPDDELAGTMVTQPGDLLSALTSSGTYREDVFQRDLLLVQAHYYDRGFVNVKVAEPRLELSPDRRSLYITIAIDEGPCYRVGAVEVRGDLLDRPAHYLDGLRARTGQTFNRSQVQQDLQTLSDELKDHGYAYVNVTPETTIDEEARVVNLGYVIDRGKLVTIQRIDIRGNGKTRDRVIRRELRVSEGDTFNQSRLDLSKRKVTATGYFERVDLSTRRGEGDDRMEVNVEVAEKNTGTFQLGAGFSSAESLILQGQISQNNLFGRGQLLTAQLQLSGLRQLFLVQFEDPYFLNTRWTFGFDLFNQQRFYRDFTRRSLGGGLKWGYQLGDFLWVYLAYQLQNVEVITSGGTSLLSSGQRVPLPSGSLANLLRSGLTSSWKASLTHDTRDNRFSPRSGWFTTASIELAEPAFLSQNQYTRVEAASHRWVPLWGPLTLHLKADGGLVTSRAPQGVPIYERYFLGGPYDVRGFPLASLSPRVRVPRDLNPASALGSFAIGGNLQLDGKAELEMPLVEKVGIRGVLFTDLGNTYNLENQYCRLRPSVVDVSQDPCNKVLPLTSLRASWGFGVRWFSPIGPLRFEFGFPFHPLPGEQTYLFEFTIDNGL